MGVASFLPTDLLQRRVNREEKRREGVHGLGQRGEERESRERGATRGHCGERRQQIDIAPPMSSMMELLERCDDSQLLDLTNHYRQRLEEAIQEALENVVFVLAYERYFSEQEYKQVIKRTKRGSRAAGSTLLLNLVTEKEPQVRKLIWKCFVKMQHLLPKLEELLKAVGEEGTGHVSTENLSFLSKCNSNSFHEIIPTGSDLIESFKAMKVSLELPAHLKGIQLHVLANCGYAVHRSALPIYPIFISTPCRLGTIYRCPINQHLCDEGGM
ncbi:uncharacterized protein LOC129694482 isoform X2 [Leucoraja erinacea]|uniref:uncharacterized protein LOC129694482 isoform X2 n=1 Tax=Leucoraja erinaceus TaxID=7782 RepID=UPI002458E57B|nr:uncharacterized protein LOC129694482 isoform X2 [Leucoraja erinacea]